MDKKQGAVLNGKHDFLNPYLGALLAFFGGYTLADWAAILGIVFGFFTFVINWHYRRKEFLLKQQNQNQVVADEESSSDRRV